LGIAVEGGFPTGNFLGMNASDYGGGTPVVDVWCRDVGIAVGHVEMAPKLVSSPVVTQGSDHASVAVEFKDDQVLKPGATLKTFRTFAAIHQGDYFETLRDYRNVMVAQGVQCNASPDSAFGPIWCAWGYGRKIKPSQIYNALPIVKKLGFTWVTLDDGGQTAPDDWFLQPQKFSETAMRTQALVDKIHAEGFKAQLWWAPLAADPGTELVKKTPGVAAAQCRGQQAEDFLLELVWYLCPADPAVIRVPQGDRGEGPTGLGLRRAQAHGQHMTTRGQAGYSRRVLPVCVHRLCVFHSAVPEHVGSVRSRVGMASPHQRQDAQRAPGRLRGLLRRPRRHDQG
jgi:alpha-galactosidase